MGKGVCTFQDEWLDKNLHPHLFWVRKTENATKAWCGLCSATIDVRGMGVCALQSHAKGAKHDQRVKARNSSQSVKKLFSSSQVAKSTLPSTSQNATAESIHSSENSSSCERCQNCERNARGSINSMDNYVTKESVAKSEIVWALSHAHQQPSARSDGDKSELFKYMFPDSAIANKFQMKKDKMCYSITFGLGPYFQHELANQVRNCEYFTASFDESLNKYAQKGQMDVIVRFWRENKAETRYLTSNFLERATAADLFAAFTNDVINKHGLCIQKLLQVSLDGPNVNKKFLKDLTAFLNVSEDAPKLLDIGTCILHVVHGSFRTSHKDSKWAIDNFLSSSNWHFKNVPSRRSAYTKCTKSTTFPVQYCATRFLENSKALKTADDILDHLITYCKTIKDDDDGDNYSSNDKTNNLIKTIKSFLKDIFLRPKIRFLLSVTNELEPFLTKYQTDWPMVPFLRNDLFTMIKDLMKRVVKGSVISAIKNMKDLQQIDLTKTSNLLPALSVDVGIATDTTLSALKKSNNVTELEILQFKEQCRKFLIKTCGMLLQKALSSKFLEGAACFSPLVMQHKNQSKRRVEVALKYLVEKNSMNALETDNLKKEYCQLISKDIVANTLKNFDIKKDRLDTFLYEIFTSENFYKSDGLKRYLRIILILFHGNADVERSFSYNKGFLVENLQEDSLIALRNVHDAVRIAGDIKNIPISKDIIKSFLNAHKHKKAALVEKQSEVDREKATKKRAAEQLLDNEIQQKRLRENFENELNLLTEEATKMKKITK